jgi:hypothetical protein
LVVKELFPSNWGMRSWCCSWFNEPVTDRFVDLSCVFYSNKTCCTVSGNTRRPLWQILLFQNSHSVHKALLHDIKVCASSASIAIAYVFLEGKKKFQPLCLISSDTTFQRISRRREFAVIACRTMSGHFLMTA